MVVSSLRKRRCCTVVLGPEGRHVALVVGDLSCDSDAKEFVIAE